MASLMLESSEVPAAFERSSGALCATVPLNHGCRHWNGAEKAVSMLYAGATSTKLTFDCHIASSAFVMQRAIAM